MSKSEFQASSLMQRRAWHMPDRTKSVPQSPQPGYSHSNSSISRGIKRISSALRQRPKCCIRQSMQSLQMSSKIGTNAVFQMMHRCWLYPFPGYELQTLLHYKTESQIEDCVESEQGTKTAIEMRKLSIDFSANERIDHVSMRRRLGPFQSLSFLLSWQICTRRKKTKYMYFEMQIELKEEKSYNTCASCAPQSSGSHG